MLQRDSPARFFVAIAAVLAAALLVAPISPADAAGFLSKTRARAKTVTVARKMYLDVDSLTGYGVESPSNCSRLSRSAVKCDYELYDDTDGIQCDDAVVVRLSARGFLRVSFPGSARCYSVGAPPQVATTPTTPTAPGGATTPTSPTAPTSPTPSGGVIPGGHGYPVMCADGTISNSGGIQGACSHHGGVA